MGSVQLPKNGKGHEKLAKTRKIGKRQ